MLLLVPKIHTGNYSRAMTERYNWKYFTEKREQYFVQSEQKQIKYFWVRNLFLKKSRTSTEVAEDKEHELRRDMVLYCDSLYFSLQPNWERKKRYEEEDEEKKEEEEEEERS